MIYSRTNTHINTSPSIATLNDLPSPSTSPQLSPQLLLSPKPILKRTNHGIRINSHVGEVEGEPEKKKAKRSEKRVKFIDLIEFIGDNDEYYEDEEYDSMNDDDDDEDDDKSDNEDDDNDDDDNDKEDYDDGDGDDDYYICYTFDALSTSMIDDNWWDDEDAEFVFVDSSDVSNRPKIDISTCNDNSTMCE
jgi:hypothetical protein